MKFALLTDTGSLVPTAVRLEAEGHEVVVVPTTLMAARVGGSDVTRASVVPTDYVVIADHPTERVGSCIGVDLASNSLRSREVVKRYLEKMGFQTPIELAFVDAAAATAFVMDTQKPFNLVQGWERPLYCATVRDTLSALSLCSPEHAVLLRRHIKGDPRVDACWLDQGTIVSGSCCSFQEHKHQMPGGLGGFQECSWMVVEATETNLLSGSLIPELFAAYTGPVYLSYVVDQSGLLSHALNLQLSWCSYRTHALLSLIESGIGELLGSGYIEKRAPFSYLVTINSPIPNAPIDNLPEIENRWLMNYTTTGGRYVVGEVHLPVLHLTHQGETPAEAARQVYRRARKLGLLEKAYCLSQV